VRWQLSLDDSSIKSQDKYIMNCHLAVHTAVNLPLSEADRLDRLFDIRPQFEQVLRSVISGVLRDELSKRRYREAMYAVPEIIEQLNRQWAERPEFRDYRDLIRVHFSALVIRPRVEAERQFITADVNLANVKEKIRSLDRKVEENRDRRRHRWEEWMCKQQEAITALAGRTGDDDDGQVDGQVDSSIKKAANALRDQMTFIGNAPPLLESVGAVFTTGLVDLENCTREVLERIKDLARLMEEVRVDYENLLRDIRALESSPAKQGGQDSGEALRPANSPELLVHLPTVNEVVP